MSISSKNNLSMLNFTTLWFGAAISVAEILAGGLLAPLGFKMGLLAILLGHLVGATLLVLGGVIGTTERIPSWCPLESPSAYTVLTYFQS